MKDKTTIYILSVTAVMVIASAFGIAYEVMKFLSLMKFLGGHWT
jgi:hypothetical protein